MGAVSFPQRLRLVAAPSVWRPWEPFERLLAAALFLVTLPILAASMGVVWMLSRQAPFVTHRRLGLGGATLCVLKLRTMWGREERARFHLVEPNVDQPGEGCKPKCDPRVTSCFAAFCRRYSIDELPQLLQVMRGELALVGPRPITAAEFERHYATSAREVLRLKPGLTGLWQVKGRSRLTYSQRRRLDLFLARRLSPSLYFYILLRTPLCVVRGRDAW